MKHIFIVVVSVFLFSCDKNINHKVKQNTVKENKQYSIKKEIPPEATPIIYSQGRLLLNAVLNDTLEGRFLIDNGTPTLILDSIFIFENKYCGIDVFNDLSLSLLTPIYQFGSSFLYNTTQFFYSDSIQGFFPMHYLSKKKYLNINIKDRYVNTLDSINTDGYVKIPYKSDKSKAFYIDSDIVIHSYNQEFKATGSIIIDFGSRRNSLKINSKFLNNYPDSISNDCFEYVSNTRTDSFRISKCSSIQISAIPDFKILNSNIVIRNINDNSSFKGYLGVLGTRFLEHFDIIIDYEDNFIYLKPLSKSICINSSPAFEKWGIYVKPIQDKTLNSEPKHEWKVVGITDEKIASDKGVSIGDIVIKINNISTCNLTISEGFELLENPKTIQIMTKKNKVVDLKI